MENNQVQLKLSLSPKLNALLRLKADRFGIPSTQLVKFLIIKAVEMEEQTTQLMVKTSKKK